MSIIEQIKNGAKLWFKKEFGVLSIDECKKLGLTFCHNIYGDYINHLNCRSIWRDENGKSYRCKHMYEESNMATTQSIQ